MFVAAARLLSSNCEYPWVPNPGEQSVSRETSHADPMPSQTGSWLPASDVAPVVETR